MANLAPNASGLTRPPSRPDCARLWQFVPLVACASHCRVSPDKVSVRIIMISSEDSDQSEDDSSSSSSSSGGSADEAERAVLAARLAAMLAARAAKRRRKAVQPERVPWKRTQKQKQGKLPRLPRRYANRSAVTSGATRRWRFDGEPKFWTELLDNPDTYEERSHHGKLFRQKFRVPRGVFDILYEETVKQKQFREKPPGGGQGRGTWRQSTKIKLLATLRILGSGCDFGFADEMADLSAAVVRTFFHAWTAWVVNGGLYELYVVASRAASRAHVV